MLSVWATPADLSSQKMFARRYGSGSFNTWAIYFDIFFSLLVSPLAR